SYSGKQKKSQQIVSKFCINISTCFCPRMICRTHSFHQLSGFAFLLLLKMGKKVNDIEDDYSAKLDLCLSDGIIKTGSGIALGAIASVLFLRRKRWPIIAGMGMGIGLAYANCENELNPKKKSQA
ncbi:uncharacterized protein, partial [Battus philenor]|uniref:uncharacterized protein n=1 Tax=Battus philenor TaxID=42288 RepID=UPI0035CECE97